MTRTTVGADEARSRLSSLLDRVEAGEIIGLSRHGRMVALLTPVSQTRTRARRAIARLRALQAGSRLNGLSVRELRDQGRP
jgi:prevent-host-death family protein